MKKIAAMILAAALAAGCTTVQYSTVYNGSYMLANLILAVVICFLLEKPMSKLPK